MDLYEGYKKLGLLPDHVTDVGFWQETLSDFGVALGQIRDWEEISLDLRLLNCALPDRIEPSTMGRAALSKKLDLIAGNLTEIFEEISSINHSTDVLAISIRDDIDLGSAAKGILSARNNIQKLSIALAEWKQPPRWREAHQRNVRRDLALLLSRIFEKHFGQKAVPAGGSHYRPIQDANEWTRFFQAVAFAFLNERETPDRQAILWEATKPEIVEYEPRVSAIHTSPDDKTI